MLKGNFGYSNLNLKLLQKVQNEVELYMNDYVLL